MMGLYSLALVYQAQGNKEKAFSFCQLALALADESVSPLMIKCLDLQKVLTSG
jgi:hypothetical protein